jgi:hypothetical protein
MKREPNHAYFRTYHIFLLFFQIDEQDMRFEILAAHGLLIALMIEASSTSETSVNLYQIIRRNNPEDSHLNTRRRQNLNSHR